MKPLPVILGFAAGFVLATVVGLAVVLPASREAWRVNVDSDVHRGVQGAMEHVEQSAAKGDCEKAAAQLKVFNERFAKYREGGPPPADWWQEVIATTRPAH
jgi:hypothetical protein